MNQNEAFHPSERPPSALHVRVREVVIEPGEDGGYVASVPSVPGVWSQGATREEAEANVREALSLHPSALDFGGLVLNPDTGQLAGRVVYGPGPDNQMVYLPDEEDEG